MRRNLPVTQHEIPFPEGQVLISRTDRKGIIRYANPAFVRISGYAEDELLGSPHNLVRHPDMPPAVFAQMWRTLGRGQLWNGIVKNRAKTGDHYWVEANVTPVFDGDRITGYTSVRTRPSREQVQAAERLYQRVNAGAALSGPLRQIFDTLRMRISLAAAGGLLGALGLGLPALAGWLMPQWWPALLLPLAVASAATTIVLVLRLLSRIDRITGEIVRIQADGDLRRRVANQRRDELGELVKAFNALMGNFQGVAHDISYSTTEVSRAASDLSAAAAQILESSEAQSEAAGHTAAAVEQITVSINEVAEHTVQTADLSREASSLSSDGQRVVQQVSAAMSGVADAVRQSSRKISALGSQSQDISKVVRVIKEIADQTNLLALNAAIEAARAGEHGRGFAVVADEVRKLAVKTGEATSEITPMIEAILAEAGAAVEAMQRCEAEVAEGVRQATEAGSALQQISAGAKTAESKVAEIAAASREQSAASQDMAVNVERVAQMVERNNASVRAASGAARSLADLAAQLKETAARFKV